jgi:predicted ATP-grasp superfamily ATP-dependent carboligase
LIISWIYPMARALIVVSDPFIASQLLICLRNSRIDQSSQVRACILDFTRSTYLRASRLCSSYRQLEAKYIGASGAHLAQQFEEFRRERYFETALGAGMDATYAVSRAMPLMDWDLRFPLEREEVLRQLNDKWRFAQLCTSSGVPHPATALISSPNDRLPEWYSGQAVVMKPLSRSGGRGVRSIPSRESLREYLVQLDAKRMLPQLIQEDVPGDDGVVGVLASNGRALAASVHVYGDNGDSAQFYNLPPLVAMAERLISTMDLAGIFEFDVRRDARDGSWWFTECNPRFWASVRLALFAGVNFVQLGLDLGSGSLASELIRPLPEGEWVRARELLRRWRRTGLRSLNIPPATWNALRSTWSDPVPMLLSRHRRLEHLT